jgi:hypothetical protein
MPRRCALSGKRSDDIGLRRLALLGALRKEKKYRGEQRLEPRADGRQQLMRSRRWAREYLS